MNRTSSSSSPTLAADPSSSRWLWIGAALAAHTGWGAYPVLARYLQTISDLPSLSILALGNFICLLIAGPFMLPRIGTYLLRSRIIWLFALVVVIRAVTNMLAARFTLAIYVQLITLMTPFVVALLSASIFREKLPPYTIPAISLSLLGALLMMSGDFSGAGLSWQLSAGDWLGIAMAFTSSLSLAFYMILIPRTVKGDLPGEAVFIVQLVTLSVVTGLVSLLIGEDWGRYAAIGLSDWLVFMAFVVFVFLGANLGQISALRHLGAPLVSSMMAWRLVSTLSIAALLLGERLTSIWQALGALIVAVTITLYLWRQRQRR
jgi:drug/metabolite transporter (DMT)-like permease